MKALIRRLRQDAALRPGTDKIVLERLAQEIESAIRAVVEAPMASHSVGALELLQTHLSRVLAEYARMGIKPPFVKPKPRMTL